MIELKTRFISAIVMLALFIPILILGGIYYSILFSILGIMALWELMSLKKNIPIYMKIISSVISLGLIWYSYDSLDYVHFPNYLMVVGMFFIYAFSIIINGDIKKYSYMDGLWLLIMTLCIGIMFNSLIKLRLIGMYPVIYCFLITIGTDSFALFGGKKFGKHKLSPMISPNKTIEGSVIGSIMGCLVATSFYYFAIGNISILVLIALTLVLTIFDQIGDLFFSSIKRYHNVKDFSNLIPGHGGVLDRLDSIIFVTMGYLIYLLII